MRQDTYRECFDNPLPHYYLEPDAGDGETQISPTVAEQDLPQILVRLPVSSYTSKARAFLNTPEARANDSPLKAFAPTETFQTLRNEADVKFLAYAHLILPVMVAMRLRDDDDLELCQEKTLPDRLRVDLAIKKKDQVEYEAVALIEYKRCEALDLNSFRDASCDDDRAQIRDAHTKAEKYRDRSVLGHKRFYETGKLVRQITAYVARSECRYAVLCDYESLILFRYEFINGDELSLDSVRITIVPRGDFLLALLGFLMEAYDDLK